jgi:hypothetical protein
VGSVSTGIPQGFLISPLLFFIYTTPLYGIVEDEGLQVTGFVDDITIYPKGSMAENTERLFKAFGKVCEWAKSMHTEIDLGDKLGFIHLNKKKSFPNIEDILLALPGRAPDKKLKLLGVVLDKKLNFKVHIEGVADKAEHAFRALRVLGGTIRGVRGSALRLIYLVCVRTVMEYRCEVWLNGDANQIKKLESIFMTARAAKWYKEITKEDGASPTINMRRLITAKVFKNYPREILNRMRQLRIGNGDIGAYLQKRKVHKNDCNRKCGEFETVQHTITAREQH